MTDISDYLRMLFAHMGTPHCPLCAAPLAIRSPHQMMEHLLSLPKGTEVEVRAPVTGSVLYAEEGFLRLSEVGNSLEQVRNVASQVSSVVFHA